MAMPFQVDDIPDVPDERNHRYNGEYCDRIGQDEIDQIRYSKRQKNPEGQKDDPT